MDSRGDIQKYRGCLFGLAVGDALGAPVEFLSLAEIKARYGENGIADFHEWKTLEAEFKPGFYTDDTQMSLATALGCLKAYRNQKEGRIFEPAAEVYKYYLEWLATQNDPNQKRAPGITCLSALRSGKMGTIEKKLNNSKGCGGVMRTAPAGLVFPSDAAFRRGAEFAAITHGHPSGYLSAGFLAEMIGHIIEGKKLEEAIERSIKTLTTYDGHEETLSFVQRALTLSAGKDPVEDSIAAIGEGWFGEEALAIALYCSLKFPNDWKSGTLAAINHSGDSDSTGSITGAILGTLLGIESIPNKWVQGVENAETIQKISEELFEIRP
jgi:ADP-ribosylglycohydrolase